MLQSKRLFNSAKVFRSSLTGKKSASGSSEGGSILNADSSNTLTKAYHHTSIALAGLVPLAFVLSPSSLNMPVDVLVGVLLPIHSHIALNSVISDYVPKGSRPMARGALLLVSLVAGAGLLKLNLDGPGLTETFKALWRKPKNA